MKDAPVELQRVMILALHTGQRYSDLIHLRWSDFDGEALHLTQSKTSVKVRVHCTAALLRMLTSTPKTCPYILARADGRPWFTAANDKVLDKAWRTHMEAAEFYAKPFAELTDAKKRSHLHFNDIRGIRCHHPPDRLHHWSHDAVSHPDSGALPIHDPSTFEGRDDGVRERFSNGICKPVVNQGHAEITSVAYVAGNIRRKWWTQSDSNARPSDS